MTLMNLQYILLAKEGYLHWYIHCIYMEGNLTWLTRKGEALSMMLLRLVACRCSFIYDPSWEKKFYWDSEILEYINLTCLLVIAIQSDYLMQTLPQIYKVDGRLCSSWSDAFFWSHLICFYTVCKARWTLVLKTRVNIILLKSYMCKMLQWSTLVMLGPDSFVYANCVKIILLLEDWFQTMLTRIIVLSYHGPHYLAVRKSLSKVHQSEQMMTQTLGRINLFKKTSRVKQNIIVVCHIFGALCM